MEAGQHSWKRPVAVRRCLAAVVAVTLMLVACGGDDKPQADDVPERAAAVVGDTEITDAALRDRVVALRRAQPRAARRMEGSRAQIEQQALSMLLSAAALEQEAEARGIRLADDEVRRRWDAAAGEQFETKAALRRFLGGQSRSDVLEQLRLQLLAERIHSQVSADAGGGKQGRKAVAEFQRDFERRWRGRTACADGRSAVGCPSGSR